MQGGFGVGVAMGRWWEGVGGCQKSDISGPDSACRDMPLFAIAYSEMTYHTFSEKSEFLSIDILS